MTSTACLMRIPPETRRSRAFAISTFYTHQIASISVHFNRPPSPPGALADPLLLVVVSREQFRLCSLPCTTIPSLTSPTSLSLVPLFFYNSPNSPLRIAAMKHRPTPVL